MAWSGVAGHGRIGLLSNENLPRGINWTTLSDPLYRELEALGAGARIAPLPLRSGRIGAFLRDFLGRDLPAARAAGALFAMHKSARGEGALMALMALSGKGRRAVFYVDPWPYQLGRIALVNRLLGIDLAFLPYSEAIAAMPAGAGRTRYAYLPYAADTQVFAPGTGRRDIDFLWMGRRHEPLHQAILAYAGAHGLTYLYRERTGFIADPAALGALAGRSRYFLVTPPDLDGGARSGGFSPLVMRYLEGLAAGCRLLGVAPRSGEFAALLPPASLLEVCPDGSDFAACYERDQENQAGWAASARASALVRHEHGWDARARTLAAALAEPAGQAQGSR